MKHYGVREGRGEEKRGKERRREEKRSGRRHASVKAPKARDPCGEAQQQGTVRDAAEHGELPPLAPATPAPRRSCGIKRNADSDRRDKWTRRQTMYPPRRVPHSSQTRRRTPIASY
ncbi:hypothetical protein AMELA_G00035560 [Ameiurus melas]|uniref:Uncharacterized protein n=1 Tax=Ameiurus melas TaxID=219545 RepID=A0A7J6B8D3_AMEME|nr:hypothetical protein AMELA_G00035560 [Ameiurus melas]